MQNSVTQTVSNRICKPNESYLINSFSFQIYRSRFVGSSQKSWLVHRATLIFFLFFNQFLLEYLTYIHWIIEKARVFQKNIYFCFIDYVDRPKLWKILKEMGIPDHQTGLLRNLYAGQEATVRTGHGTAGWLQIRTRVCQGYILLPCLFNLYEEYIMQNARLNDHKVELRLLGEVSTTSDM